MDLDRALEYVINGDAVLFAGAGFSIGATNLRGETFKTGPQLARHLALQTTLAPETSLEDAAEEFADQFGEDRLVEELQQEFRAENVADFHKQIAERPWKRIYTTNYDDVLETAYSSISRSLRPIVLSDDIHALPKEETVCIHFNGYVDRITRETIWSEIKLTDTSYVTASIDQSPWAAFFRQDVSIARAIFFIGYSLADLDIKRILFPDDALREKTFFIIGRAPRETTVQRVARFGQPLHLDTEQFANALEDKCRVYEPPEHSLPSHYCLMPFQPPESSASPRDEHIFDLLLHGEVNPDFIEASLYRDAYYYLQRSELDRAVNLLDRGERAIVVHSDLGNGKTMFIEGLKFRVIEKGYAVYSVVAHSYNILEEIEHFISPEKRTIIFVESYPDWLDVIEFIGTHANDRVSLVLTSRSSPHDTMIDRLLSMLGLDDIPELSLDRLAPIEIEWLADFLDRYGLWAEHAAWSHKRKAEYLARDCRSQFHAVLLMLLESPQIIARFEQVLNQLNMKRDYYRAVIAILTLSVLPSLPSINTLVDICGESVLSAQFRRNPTIRQLINFERGEIKFRSSVAARFILQRVADPNTTVDVLTEIARAADRNARTLQRYRRFLGVLMRFSQVENLLPEKGKRAAIIRYYEQIKSLENTKYYPIFWLQYAIACTVLEEFERADKYFDTAYSYAKSRSRFDTFQIDNYYARYLLLRAIRTGSPPSCMTAFRKARQTVNQQINDDRLQYPYRIAIMYADFYDTFESELSIKERDEVARAAKFVASRIESLPEVRRRHKDVVRCADELAYLLLRVEEDEPVESED